MVKLVIKEVLLPLISSRPFTCHAFFSNSSISLAAVLSYGNQPLSQGRSIILY
ncbi:hypothetical protein Hanom_Chr06g00481631 [Helianthus anomalus]